MHRFLVVLFSGLLTLNGLASAWAELSVVFVDGTVEYKPSMTTSWVALAGGARVNEAGFLRTGPASSVELLKAGTVRLLVAANPLAKLKFDEEPRHDRLLVHGGTALTEVFQPGATFQIRTSTAAVGVRGTKFTGEAYGPTANGSLIEAGSVAKEGDDGVVEVRKVSSQERAYYPLYTLDDLDSQWTFFLKENQAFADQLLNAPLKGKP